MGLFKFLKDKFGKKKEEKVELTPENKKEEESLQKYNAGLEKSRKNFSNKLDELAKRYGFMFVLITHDTRFQDIADRTYLVDKGNVTMKGSIYEN